MQCIFQFQGFTCQDLDSGDITAIFDEGGTEVNSNHQSTNDSIKRSIDEEPSNAQVSNQINLSFAFL